MDQQMARQAGRRTGQSGMQSDRKDTQSGQSGRARVTREADGGVRETGRMTREHKAEWAEWQAKWPERRAEWQGRRTLRLRDRRSGQSELHRQSGQTDVNIDRMFKAGVKAAREAE